MSNLDVLLDRAQRLEPLAAEERRRHDKANAMATTAGVAAFVASIVVRPWWWAVAATAVAWFVVGRLAGFVYVKRWQARIAVENPGLLR